ncbi:hypothetical protein [Spirillospora sp. NPDC047279]|uniref:hypothetical protein n=1 Tax=Spirillospora sp. NPDC047279 TaxID=3155478 RepID=UPI0033CBD182
MATLRRIMAFASLAAVTACGTTSPSGGRPCTAIGSREGVGLDIRAPDAARVDSATMTICWNGTCRTSRVELTASSAAVPGECPDGPPDGVCGASASPTGDKNGFADVQGLPKAPVKVTVDLRDAAGDRVLRRTLDVTPHATYPNGRKCGEGRPQAQLTLAGGRLSVRR